MTSELEHARFHGAELGRIAVTLRTKGLPVNKWSQYLEGKLAELTQGLDPDDRASYEAAFFNQYDAALDDHIRLLSL